MIECKFGKLQKKYTQHLTRKIFNSKSDALYFLKFKISRVVLFSIQNLSRKENIDSKLCFLKKHEKCKICRFHGVKRTKTWFFCMQTFFKICHVEKFLIQNLTRCMFFNPKSGALWKLQIKSWGFVKLSIQTLTRFKTSSPKSDAYLVFQVLTEWWYLLSTLLPIYFKDED